MKDGVIDFYLSQSKPLFAGHMTSIVSTSSFAVDSGSKPMSVLSAFETKNMAANPTLIDLYQPLVIAGMTSTFQATYQGEFIMPQTENPRDVLLVRQGDPFAAILSGVSKAVLELELTSGQQVWKGITGPEDSPSYTDYWLWVEPDFKGVLQEGHPYNFKITQCTPFPCGFGSFSYGVSIKASVIMPPMIPPLC